MAKYFFFRFKKKILPSKPTILPFKTNLTLQAKKIRMRVFQKHIHRMTSNWIFTIKISLELILNIELILPCTFLILIMHVPIGLFSRALKHIIYKTSNAWKVFNYLINESSLLFLLKLLISLASFSMTITFFKCFCIFLNVFVKI